jgi:PAS domain S-box-containing protein
MAIAEIAQALAASAARALQAAVIATTPQGVVAYWNRAAQLLYGWTAEEALGRNILELTPAMQSREQAAEIMRVLQAGEPWQGEFVVRGRDGIPFAAFVADLPLGDVANGEGVIVGVSARREKRRLVERNTGPLFAELRWKVA